MPLRCLLKKMASARTLAPLLGLLLFCQSCGWSRKHPPTYGFLLDVAKVPAPDLLAPMHYLCGDMRYIIATAAGNGRGSLNGETDLSLDQLALRIRQIMGHRALKLVYVKGDQAFHGRTSSICWTGSRRRPMWLASSHRKSIDWPSSDTASLRHAGRVTISARCRAE